MRKYFVIENVAHIISVCATAAVFTLCAATIVAIGARAGGDSANLDDPVAISGGETTFYQNCVYCHGSKGSGGSAKALQCRDMKPDYIFETITNGRIAGANVMPPWKDTFDEKTRWQLVAYIRSLRKLPECDAGN
ncbi:cytochrome c [Hyphomicrobium sp.]|uniref:c-type cytochrome n=1 Tax=Hyphomicrobium sp. TaxID=82 RepID=UPI000FC049FD|nr:MAG: cytochrome c [Hyphomicrobium sp.]